jgi:hypothetical protein
LLLLFDASDLCLEFWLLKLFCKVLERSVSGSFRENLFQFWLLIPGFVCFTDFDFFFVFITIFVTLDSFLGDRYFVVTCYYISFHFEYFIDKSIGLDNRLFLYKSSPTTRWNNLNTIYIRQRAIYPSCIHAIHLNYQA